LASQPEWETGSVVDTITVGKAPQGVAYNDVNGDLYVANYFGNDVIVISGATNTVLTHIGVGTNPVGVVYDTGNGDIYVANGGGSNLTVISAATNKVVGSINVGSNPYNIGYDIVDGEIFVPNLSSYNVSVVSDSTNRVVASIGAGDSPIDAVYDNGNGDVYVANEYSNNVTIISAATNKVVANVGVGPAGSWLFGISYDPANGDVYVSDNELNNVTVISGISNQVVANIVVGSNPAGLTYDSDNGDIYVVVEAGSVSVISGASNTLATSIKVGVDPNFVAYDSGNGNMYVTYWDYGGGTAVSVISTLLEVGGMGAYLRGTPQMGSLAESIGVGFEPLLGAYDSDNGNIYVSDVGEGTGDNVTVISGATNTVVATIIVGTAPEGVAYDSANGLVYVTNAGSNNVSVISPVTNSVVGSVRVGTWPTSVAYDSSNGDLYVANYESSNVSVISGATNTLVTSFGVGHGPLELAYDSGNGDVYVSNYQQYNMSVISGSANKVVADLKVGALPMGVVYDSGNGEVYVSNTGSDNVSVISSANNTVLSSFTVGAGPNLLAYDSGNGNLYLSYFDSGKGTNVSVISGETNTVIGTLNLENVTEGVVYDSGNGNVYVINYGLNSVDVISTLSEASSTSVISEDVGQVLMLSATLIGEGDGMLQVNALVTPSSGLNCILDPPANGHISIACAAVAAGSYDITVTVQDHTGSPVQTSFLLTVLSDPVLGAPGASVWSADVGSPVLFSSATPSGGSGDYTYSWGNLPPGCPGTSATSFSCSPTVPGLYDIFSQVVDSNGVSSAPSPYLYFTVNPDPTVSKPVSSVTSADVDQTGSVSFGTTASLGTGSYISYTWTGLPGGCTGTTTPSVVCAGSSFTTAGTLIIGVTVTDNSSGTSLPSAALAFTVHADPTAGITVTSSSVEVGQQLALTATVSGGSGPFTYAWSGLPSGCSSVNSASLTCVPTSTTGSPFSITVSVTDSNGMTAASAAAVVHVVPALSVGSLAATPSSVTLGAAQSTVFKVAVESSGTLNFTWNGLPTGCTGHDSANVSCIPTTVGTYYVSVIVKDAFGETSTSPAATFEVFPALSGAAVTPSVSDLTAGGLVVFTLAFSGGAAPFHYDWSDLPTGCMGADAASIACSPTAAGRFTPSVTITDADGASISATSTAVVVTSSSSGSGSSSGMTGTDWAMLVLALVALVLALVAMTFAVRRKGGPQSSTQSRGYEEGHPKPAMEAAPQAPPAAPAPAPTPSVASTPPPSPNSPPLPTSEAQRPCPYCGAQNPWARSLCHTCNKPLPPPPPQ
jgi:YVTN family beta-propeller protein